MKLQSPLLFIGGGNMASAILAGLLRQGADPSLLQVVEPDAAARARLQALGVQAEDALQPAHAQAALVVWAVKPQVLREAALAAAPLLGSALHLSVAAGIRSDSLAGWLGTERLVRAMPNTPALVGQGMTALRAAGGVSGADRALVEQVLAATGRLTWVEHEAQMDAVTALSGSGPAYVFYFLEAMIEAGVSLGLSAEQSRELAQATFAGSAALAAQSDESPQVLRERVTSKGGTTYAALCALEAAQVKPHFVQAMQAAAQRAAELGDEFGRP